MTKGDATERWQQLDPRNPSADLDAGGREDLLLSFNGYGVWLWMNNVSFTQLHPLVPDG